MSDEMTQLFIDVSDEYCCGKSLTGPSCHVCGRDHRRQREGDQELPEPNDEQFVQDAVISDIEERRQLGIRRYGTALQPFNGRDALRDAYEEAIDLAMYLKQCIIERDAREEQDA